MFIDIFSCFQSLSDEDSFKKCDNISDAKNKIEELLTNLLKRYQWQVQYVYYEPIRIIGVIKLM